MKKCWLLTHGISTEFGQCCFADVMAKVLAKSHKQVGEDGTLWCQIVIPAIEKIKHATSMDIYNKWHLLQSWQMPHKLGPTIEL